MFIVLGSLFSATPIFVAAFQLRPGRFPLDQQEKKSSMALSGHKRESEGGDYNDAASGSGARSYAGPMPSGLHLGMLDLVMFAF
jgi:hypothetical protein